MRRFSPVFLAALLLAALLPAQSSVAAEATVTGSLTTSDPVELSADAVAVVTLVDQAAEGGPGTILGEQRINGAMLPVAYSVTYDTESIDAGGSYALFATIT